MSQVICKSVTASTIHSTKVVTQIRDVQVETMEKALIVWLEDSAQNNVPWSGPLIREKVKRMYNHLVGVRGAANMSDAGISGCIPFQASKRWFDRFK